MLDSGLNVSRFYDSPIKQHTKSPERWIDAVGSVGGCHDDDMGSLFQTIHESQQLRDNAPLNLSVGLHRNTHTHRFTTHTVAEGQNLRSFEGFGPSLGIRLQQLFSDM